MYALGNREDTRQGSSKIAGSIAGVTPSATDNEKGRGFEPWIVREGNCEGILWIAVFLPILRGCGDNTKNTTAREAIARILVPPSTTEL
jgi:hypothetical protein